MKDERNRVNKRPAGRDEPTTEADGMVERLLHAAGLGPEIPEDGAARVKNLTRRVWRDEVATRSRQRTRLWLGGVAAAAALIIAMIYLPLFRPGTPQPVSRAIVVSLINGTLEVTPPGSNVGFLTAEDTSAEIPPGSLIRTRSGSRAALWLNDQTSLRFDSNTELRLDSEVSISLESGAVYIDSRDGVGSSVEVRTAFGTATDIGTQFEVRLEDQRLDVRVRQGMVSLAQNDDEYQITEGVTFSIDADGAVSTGVITPYDPAWSWVQEIAPTFEIEGQTVLEFLDWVSSETGLSIGFANAGAEELAATTILHGSIEGLSPKEAPEVILPSCRLTVTEEPGVLLVRQMESDEDVL